MTTTTLRVARLRVDISSTVGKPAAKVDDDGIVEEYALVFWVHSRDLGEIVRSINTTVSLSNGLRIKMNHQDPEKVTSIWVKYDPYANWQLDAAKQKIREAIKDGKAQSKKPVGRPPTSKTRHVTRPHRASSAKSQSLH